MATALALIPLVLASLGASPLAAAQRDAEPAAPAAFAAEGDPPPAPSLEPTPTPKPTPWPTPQGVKGLDVSHWNGYPDFSQLYKEGMRFVFSKASQGNSFVDDTYKRHTREARAAGLVAGAYHFFDYNKGGKAQAQHYLATLKATSGLGSLLPLVVDVETLGSLGTPDQQKAKWRLHALLDELYAKTGRYPMIYTSRYMWEQVLGGSTTFGDYPLWVACWTCDKVHLPRGWSGWDFWQVGRFKFKSGQKLDGNVWRSTTAMLGQQKQRNMRLDSGAAWTTVRTVRADLRGYDGEVVRYATDDGPFSSWQPYSRWFDLKLAKKQGQQEVRLQLRSFRGVRSPVVRDTIRRDSVNPTVWGPHVSLRRGVRLQKGGARVPVLVDIGASDATSGLASTRLSATCQGKVINHKTTTSAHPTMTTQMYRHGCVLTGKAIDVAGLRTVRKLSPAVKIIDVKPSNKAVRFVKGWKTLSGGAEAVGGTLARASAGNATLKVHIEGAQFALVVRRGPAGGRLQVIVDGVKVDTIDLYAKDGDPRRIAYVRKVPKGAHTIKLRATGTGRPASSGSIVWVDALLVLDRRK